jgi:CRP-like cAMP-binding protein
VNERPTDLGNNGSASAYHAYVEPDRLDEYRTSELSWSCRKLAPRQHVFLQGDDQSHMYLVTSGIVRLYTMLSNGRRQIIGFKSPGEFVALEYGSKHRYGAQAISATELRSVPTAAFYAVAGNDPQFLLRLYNVVCTNLSHAHDLVVTIAKRDAEESMAAFLLDIDARALGWRAKSDFVSLPMLRGDVADFLGLTSETVSRIFTNFKKRGYIEVRGRHGLRLINRRALRAISDRNAGDRDFSVAESPRRPSPAN